MLKMTHMNSSNIKPKLYLFITASWNVINIIKCSAFRVCTITKMWRKRFNLHTTVMLQSN